MNKNKTVVVYRSDLLPRSETFIREQVANYQRWQPVLAGRSLIENGLDLTGIRVALIYNRYDSFWQQCRSRLFYKVGWPKPYGYDELQRLNPALVHVHFGLDAVDAWSWVKHLNCPMVITLHGIDINIHPEWWRSGKQGDYARKYPEKLKKLAEQKGVFFVAVSEAIKKQALEKYGLPPEKVRVLYIGVDKQRFATGITPLKARQPRVLFVGRLVEKKAPGLLVQAMAKVITQLPEAELTIAGDGPMRDELEKLSRQLGLNVTFLGTCTSQQVSDEMHRARIFCLPSITAQNGDAEGFGIVLLEAQACGLPVVTSARGGRDEGIIEGETGFSFPEGDINTLADRLVIMLKDEKLLEQMGMRAREFIETSFDIVECTSRLEDYYDECVKAYGN